MEIRLEGQEALFNSLRDFERQAVYQDAKGALKRTGAKIIAQAQRNLRANGTNTTGRLSQSGRTQEVDGAVEVGFMSGEDNYAGAVEYGSRAHFFSYRKLFVWASKKLGKPVASREAHTFAYFVRNKIARFGSKPHPFFTPAVRQYENEVARAISEAIKRTIDRYGV